MKGSLHIKSSTFYAVFSIKNADGKHKTIWFNTGIKSYESMHDAEMVLTRISDMLDIGMSKDEIERRIKLDYEGDRTVNYNSVKQEFSNVNPITNQTGIQNVPTLLPVMTPTGQIVFTQEMPVKKQTPLSDYIENWLLDKKKDLEIEQLTYEGYECICKNHLIPYFKRLELTVEGTTYRELQAYFDYEAKRGNIKTGQGLSQKSLVELKRVLSQVFKAARRDKLIFDNPCEFVKLPKRKTIEASILSSKQLNTFFSSIKDEDIFPIVFLTAIYGLRRSEALGLKWDSIDFDSMTITIKHTVTKGKGSEIIEKDSTKTESSFRKYPMSKEIKELLLKQKAIEQENKRKQGNQYHNSDYVFKWEDGQSFRPDYLTRKFKKLLKQHNMPDIRFHDLRHSCASLLVSRGFQLKDVQEWLGHADISTTANIYAHLFNDRKIEILNSMTFGVEDETESDEG